MPTQPNPIRQWCKTCQDYQVFKPKFQGPTLCSVCDNEFASYYLSEVPDDKLLAQRKRYKEAKRHEFGMSMGLLIAGGYGNGWVGIVEDDAGLENVEKAERKRREEIRRYRQEQVELYRHVGRNEPCKCGSNRKYKHCCYSRIQSYL